MRVQRPKARRDDPGEALEAALRLLARREHSILELRRKLEQRGFVGDAIAPTLAALEERGYLSETRFAESLARHRAAQGYGDQRIQAELRQHALDSGTIVQAIEGLNADWGALALAQARRHFGPVPESSEARDRALRYLIQRGFSPATARTALMKQAERDDFQG